MGRHNRSTLACDVEWTGLDVSRDNLWGVMSNGREGLLTTHKDSRCEVRGHVEVVVDRM